MIEKLRILNKKLLELSQNPVEVQKYQLIDQILKDDKCFFKMNIADAYAILRDLKVQEEDRERIYLKLIDIKNF